MGRIPCQQDIRAGRAKPFLVKRLASGLKAMNSKSARTGVERIMVLVIRPCFLLNTHMRSQTMTKNMAVILTIDPRKRRETPKNRCLSRV
ncbi:MAG: hypothetical protein DRG37_03430, partial [Deltaproteobacteria bacterium]